MRILSLRLRNLNSLAGDWSFDFSHPDFLGGLFAITGPTGVGKTTILDAICLALYGATPRLGPISPTANEIMSRGHGDCLAEVRFEIPSGRFRCQWSQHRSRKAFDGKLQPARHEVVDDDSGQVIESALSKTRARVEEITGLNFERFTRSMMLAQGAFAAFLEAPPDERAELLEQITGAEIYSEISKRVHQRLGDEKRRCEDLDARLALVRPGEADEKELAAQNSELARQQAELDRRWSEKSRELRRREAAAALKEELSKLLEQEKLLKDEAGRFEPQRRRMESALKARGPAAAHDRLELLRQNKAGAAAEMIVRQAALPALEETVRRLDAEARQWEKKLAEAREAETKRAPAIAEARRLDAELKAGENQAANLRRQLTDKGEIIRQTLRLPAGDGEDLFTERLAAIEDRLKQRREHLKSLKVQLKEVLSGQTASQWQDELDRLAKRLGELEKLLDLNGRLAALTDDLAGRRKIMAEAQSDLEKNELNLRLENERLAGLEKEGRHLGERSALIRRISSLEEERRRLTEGQACPLCGSLDHPWSEAEAVPAADAAEAELTANQKLCQEKRELINRLTGLKSAAAQLLKSNRTEEAKLLLQAGELAEAVRTKSEFLALPPAGAAEAGPLLEAERARAEKLRELIKKAAEREKEIAAEREKIQTAAEALHAGRPQVEEFEAWRRSLGALETEVQKNYLKRLEILGDTPPEAEEKRLRALVEAAEKSLAASRLALEKAAGEVRTGHSLIKEGAEQLARLDRELEESQSRFLAAARAAGFEDEENWRLARLEEAELQQLQGLANELREKELSLKARRDDLQRRLKEQQAEEETLQNFQELQLEVATLEKEREQNRLASGALAQRLADARQSAESRRALSAELEAGKRGKNRWEKLHELIGSGDGKKFRNFAQGLTFDLLAGLANRQLKDLSDRYFLIRDPERPLEFSVMDNYQAGEIRSTKNLSGGEKFIVSLALALGLSHMASRRVRVDSLFLDEGFGSLDPDSLETVLETLSGLREDGRLIGLISHVPALTERIAVQIKVTHRHGPHSAVSGPGVSEG